MRLGRLLPEHFLREGIRTTEAYQAFDNLPALRERLAAVFAAFPTEGRPNEAQTEQDLIFPVLDALGWDQTRRVVQPTAARRGRSDVPDVLLCATPGDKGRADRERERADGFRHGLLVVESKRWERPLDRAAVAAGGRAGGGDEREVPSSQMLRYLSRAETVSDRRVQWGILTNGRVWRLYWQAAKSRSEEYLELDLALILGARQDLLGPPEEERDHWLVVLALLFGRAGHADDVAPGRNFVRVALDQGRLFEEELTGELDKVVFGTVFKDLVEALDRADPARVRPATPAYLAELKTAALTLLYRLLFVLYAEDRDLLPVRDPRYDEYGLSPLRDEVARRRREGDALSRRLATYWPRLKGLFAAIDGGDEALGLPPYNGGLFSPAASPLLERAAIADADFAPLLLGLSHREVGGTWRRINYRDLSVQQLGSVYERLLEHEPVARPGGDGGVVVEVAPEQRKRSGSFYTPDALVRLILARTIQPLLDQITATFGAAAERLAGDTRGKQERLADLARLDPATRFLDLKICDPAMGSGHFLVSTVDYLADRVLEAMAAAPLVPAVARFAPEGRPYESPLAERLAAIRRRILASAERGGWRIDAEGQLADRQLVRRVILKRVIFGVDKNPMAVELAKVALWLHTFTVGAPLSFLDHHLRAGDSLLGGWAGDLRAALTERGGLLSRGLVARVEHAARAVEEVEAATDSDIAEVEHSRLSWGAAREVTEPLAGFMSLVQAERLMGVLASAPTRRPKPIEQLRKAKASALAIERAERDWAALNRAEAWQEVLDGGFGDPFAIAAGTAEIGEAAAEEQFSLIEAAPDPQQALLRVRLPDNRRRAIARELVGQARRLAAGHGFLHWQVAFPTVWRRWLEGLPEGGFDVVIGNPPYVRQERLGEIKPALKAGYAAYDGVADLYVYFYELGLKLLRPGGRLSYVVTNKWLKAGYAERLRELLGERAWLDLVVDFGHAKQFFPDADVFPCVIVAERPDAGAAPETTETCLIPREDVRPADLVKQVAELSFPLPRAGFSKVAWVLEPPEVMALLRKIRDNGVPLAEYAGVRPLYGIKTGLNEAFLIDTATRDRLVAEDVNCSGIIRPYLRGQDVERWHASWQGSWMIFARRGIRIERYPSVLKHLENFRSRLELRPSDWELQQPDEKWRGRKPGNYPWYELQNAIDYHEAFDKPKIIYNDIVWRSSFFIDEKSSLLNNTTYFIPSADRWIAAVFSAAVGWWYAWRTAQHAKDEALRYFNDYVETYPFPACSLTTKEKVATIVDGLHRLAAENASRIHLLSVWYRDEFGIERPGADLEHPFTLTVDDYASRVRKARGARRPLSAAAVQAIREEWERTVRPARMLLAEAGRLERELSDLVNAAYGLTPEEVALVWRTAPPRMPPPGGP